MARLQLFALQLSQGVRQHSDIFVTGVMYFVMLIAHPKPHHPKYGETDGAYAACWVDALDAVVAESRARSLIEQVGWDSEEVEESYPVVRAQYESSPETLALFDQALQDGVVVKLHTWPVGGDDEV